MAWGILMTALSLFGMMGLAIFEATYVELPSKPDVNREESRADEPRTKKAA